MQTKPKQNSSKQPAAVQPQARQMPPAEVNPFAPGGAAPQEAQAGAQQTFPVPVDGQMVELTLEELIQAADKLEAGQVTDVIETDTGYYVAKVTSTFDQSATDSKKQEIISERESERYNEILDGWKEDTDIKENKDVWEKIDFNGQGVALKTEDSSEDSGSTEGSSENTDGEDTSDSTDSGESTDSENTDNTEEAAE